MYQFNRCASNTRTCCFGQSVLYWFAGLALLCTAAFSALTRNQTLGVESPCSSNWCLSGGDKQLALNLAGSATRKQYFQPCYCIHQSHRSLTVAITNADPLTSPSPACTHLGQHLQHDPVLNPFLNNTAVCNCICALMQGVRVGHVGQGCPSTLELGYAVALNP